MLTTADAVARIALGSVSGNASASGNAGDAQQNAAAPAISPPVVFDVRPPVTPTGKPPPLAVRLAKALPFQRAQVEMRDALTVHDGLHTADGAHAQAPWSPVRRQGTDDVMTHTQRPQGGRAFRPFLHVAGPLWGPSSNYPLCG